jgi:hypothetical protein
MQLKVFSTLFRIGHLCCTSTTAKLNLPKFESVIEEFRIEGLSIVILHPIKKETISKMNAPSHITNSNSPIPGNGVIKHAILIRINYTLANPFVELSLGC